MNGINVLDILKQFPVCEAGLTITTLNDAIRKEIEPMVWATAKIMVRSLFTVGHDDVILDATNTTNERRSEWESSDWNIKYYVFSPDVELSKKRAIDSGQEYLIPVIEKMNEEFEFPYIMDFIFA